MLDGEEKLLAQPPLTRVDRAIRQETLPIFYGRNTFQLGLLLHQLILYPEYEWLKYMGNENRRSLKQCYIAAEQDHAEGYIHPFAKNQLLRIMTDWGYEVKLGEYVKYNSPPGKYCGFKLQRVEFI